MSLKFLPQVPVSLRIKAKLPAVTEVHVTSHLLPSQNVFSLPPSSLCSSHSCLLPVSRTPVAWRDSACWVLCLALCSIHMDDNLLTLFECCSSDLSMKCSLIWPLTSHHQIWTGRFSPHYKTANNICIFSTYHSARSEWNDQEHHPGCSIVQHVHGILGNARWGASLPSSLPRQPKTRFRTKSWLELMTPILSQIIPSVLRKQNNAFPIFPPGSSHLFLL